MLCYYLSLYDLVLSHLDLYNVIWSYIILYDCVHDFRPWFVICVLCSVINQWFSVIRVLFYGISIFGLDICVLLSVICLLSYLIRVSFIVIRVWCCVICVLSFVIHLLFSASVSYFLFFDCQSYLSAVKVRLHECRHTYHGFWISVLRLAPRPRSFWRWCNGVRKNWADLSHKA